MLYALTAFQKCEHSIFPLRSHCRRCRRLGLPPVSAEALQRHQAKARPGAASVGQTETR
jgi:hypothetical protein